MVNAISRGDLHALDNFCDLAGPVAARIGQFVHLGRVHTYLAGHRSSRPRNQSDHGTQAGALSL